MKVILTDPPIPGALKQSMARAAKNIRAGMIEAADAASKAILDQGRADISGAGRFGARWTEGLTSDVEDQSPRGVTITVRHAVPYWTVFQYGKEIHGKPLLWIPLTDSDAVGISAKDYPGRLFRVDRKAGGAPLLMSAEDKEVKYTGHESVDIPKKFHLVEICKDVADKLGQLYKVSAGA